MLDEAATIRLADVDAFELAKRLRDSGHRQNRWAQPAPSATYELHEGSLLGDRYRILHRVNTGWVAYDERLTRPVIIEALTGPGTPSERIRREAAGDQRLSDAIVVGDGAFAVRTTAVM